MVTMNYFLSNVREVYVKPESKVYEIECSNILCASSIDNDGAWGTATDPTEGNAPIDVFSQRGF